MRSQGFSLSVCYQAKSTFYKVQNDASAESRVQSWDAPCLGFALNQNEQDKGEWHQRKEGRSGLDGTKKCFAQRSVRRSHCCPERLRVLHLCRRPGPGWAGPGSARLPQLRPQGGAAARRDEPRSGRGYFRNRLPEPTPTSGSCLRVGVVRAPLSVRFAVSV